MDAAPTELALWQKPPVDVVVETHQIIECFPTIAVDDGSSLIEFRIPANNETVLDLYNTTFRCGFQIVKEDGTKLVVSDKVCIANIPLHTALESVDITIGGKSLTAGTGNNYPYKAYIDMVVNGGSNDHEASAAGLVLDTVSGMDTVGTAVSSGRGINSGSLKRAKWSALSKTVVFEGQLFSDICRQRKYIPLTEELHIRLHQSKDAFRLMAATDATNYKLKLVKPILRVRSVQLTSQGIRELSLNRGNYLIPIKNNVISTYNIASGQFSFHIDTPFAGRIPNRLIAGMLTAKAFEGSYTSNPFNFQDFNVKEMAFMVNEHSLPGPPIETDYDDNEYVTAYRTLTSSLYPTRVPLLKPYTLTSTQYHNGYCFTVFPLNGESNTGELITNPKFALTRFSVKFKSALAKAITLILYATFDDVLEIPV
jgi:hypothetical protein